MDIISRSRKANASATVQERINRKRTLESPSPRPLFQASRRHGPPHTSLCILRAPLPYQKHRLCRTSPVPPAEILYGCSTPNERTRVHLEALRVNDHTQAGEPSRCSVALLGCGFVPDHKALVPRPVDDVAHRRKNRNRLLMIRAREHGMACLEIPEYCNGADGLHTHSTSD